jgi:hypothetical protein
VGWPIEKGAGPFRRSCRAKVADEPEPSPDPDAVSREVRPGLAGRSPVDWPRPIGFAARGAPRLFPCGVGPESSRSFAGRVTAWLDPPSSCRLFRAPSPPNAARALSSRAACLGSWPSSRHHRGASTVSSGSQPRAPFRPQAITASRRFAPRSGSEACCILEPRSGHMPAQGVLSPRSTSDSSPFDCPHAVSARALARISRPALPGSSRLDFEALLRVEQRSYRLGVSLTGLPLPSPGSISSGSPGSRPSPGYPGRSARDVTKSDLRLRARRSPPSSAYWHPREGVVLSPETTHPHEFSSLPIRNFP